MKVHVRCTGLPHSHSLVEHTTRRVHQHLSRFGDRLAGVEVRLSDVNGPRGGRDKRCQVIAHGPGLGLLRIEELHEDFYGGVERALARLSQAVGRGIARARERYVEAERRAS
ncbi:MAG: HPF/RaiA family ribosome-associated protein [Deltaproteobacteria bacterium]|jgi:putative sigma-54 modulation protein|nr:HPF/RaiA family ribosome-associated protein [Deltaproteobacteria bacterium]